MTADEWQEQADWLEEMAFALTTLTGTGLRLLRLNATQYQLQKASGKRTGPRWARIGTVSQDLEAGYWLIAEDALGRRFETVGEALDELERQVEAAQVAEGAGV